MAAAALVAVLDQATKWWIVERLMQSPRILPVVPGLNMVLVYNRGITFGMFNSDAAQPLIAEAKPFALVVQPAIRVAIRKLVRSILPDTPVMSFFEVPEDKAVEVVAVIGGQPQHQALAA